MTHTKKVLLTLLSIGALAFNSASAELTVITVSMQKLFDGYYKSTEANERLQSLREQAMSEAQTKEQELQGMADEIRSLQEEMQNPMLSDDAKAEKQQSLQKKVEVGRGKQAEFQKWQQTTMNDLNARSQEVRGTLIKEIAKIVNDIALKSYSADLVLDTSDILGSGVPTVLYADSDLDITDKVLIALNKDAPNN